MVCGDSEDDLENGGAYLFPNMLDIVSVPMATDSQPFPLENEKSQFWNIHS